MSHHDRLIVGGASPAGGSLELPVPSELRSDSFCSRRELAIVGVDGAGEVEVGGQVFPVGRLDVLYIGRGAADVVLRGQAVYYLVSTPAHQSHPTTLTRRDAAATVHLGEQASANVRTIRKYVHADGVASCQLVLGITELAEGSVWNTMPCHTHERRTETYFYFGLRPDDRVIHLCGTPEATRSMVVADRQAVISPPWSVHCGAGTRNYAFVWAMGGENVAYDDIDVVPTQAMR